MKPEPYDKKIDDKATEEFKPLAECQTIGDILICCSHLVKELNKIPGVKAKMEV